MYFNIAKAKLIRLQERLNLLAAMALLLGISNIALLSETIHLFNSRQIEITPFFGPSYVKAGNSVDSEYLKLMAQNFIFLRFNVNPHNIHSNNEALLAFVAPSAYREFAQTLLKDEKNFIEQELSSYFSITATIPNASQSSVVIRGTLHQSLGIKELEAKRVAFVIKFDIKDGKPLIVSFHKEAADV
jgi:type IV conjugative transfer system protein TraE